MRAVDSVEEHRAPDEPRGEVWVVVRYFSQREVLAGVLVGEVQSEAALSHIANHRALKVMLESVFVLRLAAGEGHWTPGAWKRCFVIQRFQSVENTAV